MFKLFISPLPPVPSCAPAPAYKPGCPGNLPQPSPLPPASSVHHIVPGAVCGHLPSKAGYFHNIPPGLFYPSAGT